MSRRDSSPSILSAIWSFVFAGLGLYLVAVLIRSVWVTLVVAGVALAVVTIASVVMWRRWRGW